MRKISILLLAIWVVATCAGCGPAQAPQVEAVTALPTFTPAPAPTATPAPTPLPSLTPTPRMRAGGLFVDASLDLGPVSPFVYGSNYGPWLFVTLDNKEDMLASGLTYMRWPGGNWGDLNDVDAYMLDTFMSFCRLYGVEPAISVRLRGGTPQKAVTILKYMQQRGYTVHYWSIGNEPNLYKDYDIERFNREWRQIAEAMRAVDPNLILIGPDTNQFSADLSRNPKDAQGRDWLVEFLKANGDLVDIVAVHRYPFPACSNCSAPLKDELRANSQEWDQIIPALRAVIRETTGRDLPVAVTEVNSSWAANRGGEGTMESHYNAIWWGDALGRMIRQGTDIVAQFAVVGDFGLMDKYDPYPIYFVYRMYQHFGTQRVLATSDDALVSVFAARRADGALTLMFVNLASAEKTVPLAVENFKGNGTAQVYRFDAQHAAEQVEPGQPVALDQITLPPESMTLYILE